MAEPTAGTNLAEELPQGGGFLLTDAGARPIDTADAFTPDQLEFYRAARKFGMERVVPASRGHRGQGLPHDPGARARGRRARPALARHPRGVRGPGPGPDHQRARGRGHDRAGGLVGHLRRTGRHRHAPHRLLRDPRAAGPVPAPAPLRRMGRRLRPLRGVVGLRRAGGQDPGRPLARRQALDPERHQAVDLQRRLRRRLHRLRQGRRRQVHRLHRGPRHARVHHGCRGAQDGDPGQLDAPAHLRGRDGPGRKPARRDRQGTPHRLQHPERRPAQAGRHLHGRGPARHRALRHLRPGAEGLREAHLRLRPDPGEARPDGGARLRGRGHELPDHRSHRPARRGGRGRAGHATPTSSTASRRWRSTAWRPRS